MHAREKCLKDAKRHLPEVARLLIAMHALVEIGLAEGFHAPPMPHVHQVRGLDAITDGEWNFLQHLAPNGIFARERLDNGGQFGNEQRE